MTGLETPITWVELRLIARRSTGLSTASMWAWVIHDWVRDPDWWGVFFVGAALLSFFVSMYERAYRRHGGAQSRASYARRLLREVYAEARSRYRTLAFRAR